MHSYGILGDMILHGDDAAPHGNETILVVEDDELVREFVIEVLIELGYRVLLAADGTEALAALNADQAIDLFFADIKLPHRVNGIELARSARQRRPALKVLLTSGDTKQIPSEGGFPSISKPYRRLELATRLREILDR
jgi:CheY-like chemotaxis protein